MNWDSDLADSVNRSNAGSRSDAPFFATDAMEQGDATTRVSLRSARGGERIDPARGAEPRPPPVWDTFGEPFPGARCPPPRDPSRHSAPSPPRDTPSPSTARRPFRTEKGLARRSERISTDDCQPHNFSHRALVIPACLRMIFNSVIPKSPPWGFGIVRTRSSFYMNSCRPPEYGPVNPARRKAATSSRRFTGRQEGISLPSGS